MAIVKPRRLGAYSTFANGFMALFMVAVLGAVGYALWQDRENRLELQLQRAKGNALIFEDQVSQTLQLIENTIRTLPDAAGADLSSRGCSSASRRCGPCRCRRRPRACEPAPTLPTWGAAST